jgi:hypothetical protein
MVAAGPFKASPGRGVLLGSQVEGRTG